jgi:sterol O-acyltransferase
MRVCSAKMKCASRLGVGFFLLKTAAENYRAYGHIFGVDILSIMFRPHHLFDCLLTDAIMFYGSTLWNVPLQKAVQKGAISWDRTAWILQSIWQFVYIYFIISYTLYKEWPWIQTVFLVLHCIVMLMKQHSYVSSTMHQIDLLLIPHRHSTTATLAKSTSGAAFSRPSSNK